MGPTDERCDEALDSVFEGYIVDIFYERLWTYFSVPPSHPAGLNVKQGVDDSNRSTERFGF